MIDPCVHSSWFICESVPDTHTHTRTHTHNGRTTDARTEGKVSVQAMLQSMLRVHSLVASAFMVATARGREVHGEYMDQGASILQ